MDKDHDTVVLKRLEIELILDLLKDNKESRRYWGRKLYFMNRQDRVIMKMKQSLRKLNNRKE